jgi:hypothetical protein
MRILGGCVSTVILTVCVAPTIHPMMAKPKVNISFDTAGCPTSVNPSTPIEITKAHGDKVQ